MKPDYLIQRNGVWQYHRRVPRAYVGLAGKSKFIVISTKIAVADDRTGAKAGRVAARLNEQQEAQWRSLASGMPDKQRWQDAVTIARSHGLDYLSPVEAAQRETSELLARIETLKVGDRKSDVGTVDAVLGAVDNVGFNTTILAVRSAQVNVGNVTWSLGSFSVFGKRFEADDLAMISVFGANPNTTIPGSTNGTTSNGGQCA
jgi:hypothetical protein